MEVKQALKDNRFRENLPDEFKNDLVQYLNNPSCSCNLPFYRRILKDAQALLKRFYPGREVLNEEEEIAKLASELHRNLVKGRNFYLDIARCVDSINLKIYDLDKDKAREVLKIFEDNISPYQHEIQKIKNYCNNNVHIQKIEKYLASGEIKKVIYIKGRTINFVVL